MASVTNPIPIENIFLAWKATCIPCRKCKYVYSANINDCKKCKEMIWRYGNDMEV